MPTWKAGRHPRLASSPKISWRENRGKRAHIERFRRALVMLRVPDPDTVIAERLSGQSPFMATDHFIDLNDPTPEPAVPVDVSVRSAGGCGSS